MIFLSYGAVIYQSFSGEGKGSLQQRKLVLATQGLGLTMALIGGFGLLAKLAIPMPWPTWVWVKVSLWLILASGVSLIFRKPQMSKIWWILTVFLGLIGVTAAVIKF